MELLKSIPIIGGLVAAIQQYIIVLFKFARSPFLYIPSYALEETTGLVTSIKILTAGLILEYLLFFPLLKTDSALAVQPIYLAYKTFQLMVIIPIIHLAFKAFGSVVTLRRSFIFYMIVCGLVEPIRTALKYPLFIAYGDCLESLLYFSHPKCTVNREELYGTHTPLITNILMLIQVVLVYMLLKWFKQIYSLGWWRTIGAIILGMIPITLVFIFVFSKLWRYLEPFVSGIAKIA